MATDPKLAPLADDLKELALYAASKQSRISRANTPSSLPTSAFPKAFFCALCSELAIDSFKLLCCNKAICTPCMYQRVFAIYDYAKLIAP
jgi:formylmethanofuran dehydrogenase subunit E